jgi:hypothetical protein
MSTIATLPPAANLIVRYATFHNEPGYAIRTPDRRVIFVDHDAASVTLTTADIPFLVVLGDVNTAEAQSLCDFLAGGAAAICVSRKQEVA